MTSASALTAIGAQPVGAGSALEAVLRSINDAAVAAVTCIGTMAATSRPGERVQIPAGCAQH